MRYFISFLSIVLLLGCKSAQIPTGGLETSGQFTIAFGSCNKHNVKNILWDDVLAANPDIWIWGGDIVYADSDDPQVIASMYNAQKAVPGYREVLDRIPVIGTWDDHDYGLNDGGEEFAVKRESQEVFLDFIGAAKDDPRRKRAGVYASHDYNLPEGKVRILVLDTRYFRTALTASSEEGRRYEPGEYGKGTVLGEEQWAWLENELRTSEADFNILVSSIQVLSGEHGFETWGNFPHEVDKLETLISESGARGVIILSGDRHISEFSEVELPNLPYPLVDFTSSGLTHVYSGFSGEPNRFRIGAVVAKKSFGLLDLDLKGKSVRFLMVGDGGEVQGELRRQY